ncbi:hypothetical protein DZ936_031450, partial [Pseudomonas aeruginosa]|nr:hypothetical protein [Pseudomonas aeruginosa]
PRRTAENTSIGKVVDPRAWGARLGSLRRDGAEALRRAGFLGEADSAAG